MPNSATILLAEDNRLDALLLVMAFKKMGMGSALKVVHDGVGVVNYLKGVDLYADRTEYPFPGVLLLDMRMPTMNGFEVLKWKETQQDLCGLPVVVIGDCMSPDWVLQAYQYGASCVLSKTQDLFEFAGRLKKLVDAYLSVGLACTRSLSPAR